MSSSKRSSFEQCALASGLLVREQFDEVLRSLCANGSPCDEKRLADRLIEMGLLNAWQASQLFDGRTKFTLGPYKIIDSLGQGGMGQVFKAQHSVSGRIVAVKVLPKAKSTPEAIVSFENEIRALARMDHHKLVRALDTGQDGSVYYLVTEFVPGCDLRKLVRRDGPLDMEQAAIIIYQVAEALSHAHARGLIHRDVKPGNVLVTPEDEAKLSDLGLAGPTAGDAEKDPRFGKIVGTADYLSPDHIKAPWDPQPAWDIYSLGCTLYYAVTGKVPFPGGTTSDKARAHCELRPLDPRRLNGKLSLPFVDVLADMMAKDPAQRIRSAEEVMLRLLPWIKRPLPGSSKTSEQPEASLEHQFAPMALPPTTASRDAAATAPRRPVVSPAASASAAAEASATARSRSWQASGKRKRAAIEPDDLSDTMVDGAQQVEVHTVAGASPPLATPPERAMPVVPVAASSPPAPPVVRPTVVPVAVEEAAEAPLIVPFWQQHRLGVLIAVVAVPTLLCFLAIILGLVHLLAG